MRGRGAQPRNVRHVLICTYRPENQTSAHTTIVSGTATTEDTIHLPRSLHVGWPLHVHAPPSGLLATASTPLLPRPAARSHLSHLARCMATSHVPKQHALFPPPLQAFGPSTRPLRLFTCYATPPPHCRLRLTSTLQAIHLLQHAGCWSALRLMDPSAPHTPNCGPGRQPPTPLLKPPCVPWAAPPRPGRRGCRWRRRGGRAHPVQCSGGQEGQGLPWGRSLSQLVSKPARVPGREAEWRMRCMRRMA